MTQRQRTSLPTAALDYDLPEALIATRPAEPRDSARMLVVWRGQDRVEHRRVSDLAAFVERGDIMVFNNTAVAPARFHGQRVDSGGAVEGLFLREVEPEDDGVPRWLVMLKSNGRLRPGLQVRLGETANVLDLIEKCGDQWLVRAPGSAHDILSTVGQTPLPPYITRARRDRQMSVDDADDRSWYQTVYADLTQAESVAAPTAGLHFSDALLERIDARGVERRQVTLHVGAGTFKPVSAETLDDHPMHYERYSIDAATLERIRQHRAAPTCRLIAVGTTTVRTLESIDWDDAAAGSGETDLMIAPGFEFQIVDGLLTNFHLPRSTLLALVGAMLGLERLHEIYRIAIAEKYRFYSYGDAMLILP